MKQFKNPVLVLGGDLTALGAVRKFGKLDIDVYLIMEKIGIAAYSKYIKKSFMDPGMRLNRSILKKLLIKVGKKFSRRAVIYPTSDLDALNLSELKDILPDDYHIIVGDKEPVKMLVNKIMFYKELARNGISFPKTYFPENIEDARRIGTEIEYPLFIKPAISQLFHQFFPQYSKGFIVYSLSELLNYYQLAIMNGIEVMFQEIIPGPPTNSYQLEGYYKNDHRPSVLFARQRLRIWKPDFGNTSLCISIPVAKLAKEKNIINQFIRTIGYSGLMSAEFKKDERDGLLKLLEINARLWWHFWLSGRCGADILLSSYLDMIGEKTNYIEQYQIGIKSIYFVNDLTAAANMFLNRTINFREWEHSYHGVRISSVFARDDISPFLIDCMKSASRAFARIQGLRSRE